MTQWVNEWLAEIEEKESQEQFKLSSLQADQCLQKISELEAKLNDVEALAVEDFIPVCTVGILHARP
jgi:hypothetical protein